MDQRWYNQRGISLLEVMLAVAAAMILAGILILAWNPVNTEPPLAVDPVVEKVIE